VIVQSQVIDSTNENGRNIVDLSHQIPFKHTDENVQTTEAVYTQTDDGKRSKNIAQRKYFHFPPTIYYCI